MAFIRRTRWNVLVGMLVLLMFCLNVVFIVDLTVNHRAHSHLITALQDRGPQEVTGEKSMKQFINLRVKSSKTAVEVHIGHDLVYSSNTQEQRGIHIVVLNEATGKLMASRVFDTYIPGSENHLISFINFINNGRVLCMAVQDEATFSLHDPGRNAIKALGSKLISTLSWRDMWAFVTVKGGDPVGEDIGKALDVQSWGASVTLAVTLPLSDSAVECDWPNTSENHRRKEFCSRYEGYGALCHCANPLPLNIRAPKLLNNNIANVPVSIIASNRPLYLFRMLRGLLSVPGANVSLISVFVDGFFQEPVDVASLFNIQAVQHKPQSQKNGRISQHYKASLKQTFDQHPHAKYAIIIEEDLDVSPDFFSYFSQTAPLLEEDNSVYCISAWNDQGYEHSCQDPSLLYRVETMPGLGWMLKRTLFKEELEPNWPSPDKLWDWDMWMRLNVIRKDRECIIPDISRTYHFGSTGLNMNPYFQDRYFKRHSLNTLPDVSLKDVNSLKKEEYEVVIHNLFRQARVLDHSKDPCQKDFIPNTKGKVYVMYIAMKTFNNFDNWMKLATCFHLWDLDARGFHKGLWRFWIKSNHILVVGHPYSPYSSKYKPAGITPLTLTTSRPSGR